MKRSLLLCLAVVAASGCKKGSSPSGPLRLGYFPNVTHAQPLVGVADGTFARVVGKPIETKTFNAGPAAMEALLSGSLDLTYVGPSPAINSYIKSKGGLRVIAGACSGGAVFITRTASSAAELKGKKVASPQLGNTQDVALRHWLRENGLKAPTAYDRSGDVELSPISNADIMTLFKMGQLEGAWVPEPWGARLIAEAGGKILIDERKLWENGAFPTTLLVASKAVLDARREDVKLVLQAHIELTERANKDPAAFHEAANKAFGALMHHELPKPILDDAFSRMELTLDPMSKQVSRMAEHAKEFGFISDADVSGIVDDSLLKELGRPVAVLP